MIIFCLLSRNTHGEEVEDDKVSLINKNALPTNNFSSQAISILKENSGRYVEGRCKVT